LRAGPLAPTMRPIRVRLFATGREAVGRATVDWPVPPRGIPARELVAGLGREYPRLAPILRTSRFLRNDRYLDDLTERIAPGDEFSVHPPYSGG
jgi:molybdopterin converting factor small subunit